MNGEKRVETKELPEVLDIYVVNEDGSVAEGAGLSAESVDVFIEEDDSGRLFEVKTALYIRANYGKVVGVMRHQSVSTLPTPYRNRKMILGKANLP